MRQHFPAFLVLLLSISSVLLMNTDRVSAQTNVITDEITTAKNDIVRAFQSIQTAEHEGASKSDLQPLIIQLNQALRLEENATILAQRGDSMGASNAALQSIGLSTNVSLEAANLGNQAQTASQNRSNLAYGIAVLSAIVAAFVVLEAHRVAQFLRGRRLRKAEIEHEDGPSAK